MCFLGLFFSFAQFFFFIAEGSSDIILCMGPQHFFFISQDINPELSWMISE